MPIANVVNACAHLQNASRARLGLTSIPNTKFNLLLCLALHRSGLISTVVRGGPSPPDPTTLLTMDSVQKYEPVTTATVATRRLWLGLKYNNNEPVMHSITAITKAKRPITQSLRELRRVARGFEAGYIDGLKMGECMFLATDSGVLEIREALERKVGGLILCRVSPY